MPIYEYHCESCAHKLEKLQRMSEEKLVDCPACGEPTLKRLVSAAAFRLKGSGWYETDFKNDNKRNLADSVPESASKDNADKKSDKTSAPGSSDKKSGDKQSTDSKSAAKSATTTSKDTSGKASVA